jgi:hypothetical protein
VVWQWAGQSQSQVVKGYLFISVDTLGAAGIYLGNSGSITLETLVARISRLSPEDRQSIRFEMLVMDSVRTTHVIFPQRTLHWVVTEAATKYGAVYCGIGAYFLPNAPAALDNLQASLTDNLADWHTAQQPLGTQAALAALVSHRAGFAKVTTPPPEYADA